MNGHAGMLLSKIDYATLAPDTHLVPPVNPGVYSIGVTAANCSQMKAMHKEQTKVFKTFAGVRMGLKDLILKAIDNNYLLETSFKCSCYSDVDSPLQTLGCA